MSISWSRLFPQGNEVEPNKAGVEHYRAVFEELKKYNIEPLVTIWHFDTPLWLEERPIMFCCTEMPEPESPQASRQF